MSINRLYHTWFQKIEQSWPELRVTQTRNLAWLLTGIYYSRSVHLNDIAGCIPARAKLLSVTRRLSRFLANPAIQVRKLYEAIVHPLLEEAVRSGEIRLLIDSTKIGFNHQLLMIALAYRHRALPIAWMWSNVPKGHCSAAKQLALLAYVHRLIPKQASVVIVGDCEFGAVEMLAQLDEWGWHYVLRQPSSNLIDLTWHNNWQRFDQVLDKPGDSQWLGKGHLTREHIYPTKLVAHWQVGEDEPWLLATNLPSKTEALRAYRRRMWIEEMFGDMKKHGFDLESTHLCHFSRLSRLTLVVALLYVWLVTQGVQTIKNGQRHLVDRKDRRDLCVFQIGWRLVQRKLVNAVPISIQLCPSYCHW